MYKNKCYVLPLVLHARISCKVFGPMTHSILGYYQILQMIFD